MKSTNPVTALEQLKPLSLRANFSWTLVGNVVYAGCSWLMLVVLAKLGTPELVGRFSLGLAVTAPIIIFANLQLRAIQATDTRDDYLFRDYLGLRLVMLLLALLVIAGIVFTSGYELETALVILIIGLGKAVDSVSDVIYGQLQQHERMDTISISLILKGILSLLLLTAGQVLTGSVVWAATGWSVASLIMATGYDIHNARLILRNKKRARKTDTLEHDSLVPRFNLTVLRQLTWLALPLGITMLLISLNTNIPRYFVERYTGEYGLGIYAALAYLMTAGSTVIMALGQSASPRLAKMYAARDAAAFRKLILRLVMIAVLLGGAGIAAALAAGRLILTLIYQAEYAEHSDVFMFLMLGAAISYTASFAGFGITAARYFKIQPVIFSVGILANIAACALLIPTYGLHGAAWTAILTNAVQLVLMYICLIAAFRKLQGKAVNA